MEEEVPSPPFRKSALPFTCKSISLSLSLHRAEAEAETEIFPFLKTMGNCIFPRILDVFNTSFECGASFSLACSAKRYFMCKKFREIFAFCARREQFFKNWSVQRDLNIIEFLFLYRHLFFLDPRYCLRQNPFFSWLRFLQYVSNPRRQSRNVNAPRERERHKNALQQHLLQPLQSFPTNQRRRRKFDAENLFLRNVFPRKAVRGELHSLETHFVHCSLFFLFTLSLSSPPPLLKPLHCAKCQVV